MRFKFKSFLFALIGVVSIATTTAFSYFVFDDVSNSNAIIEEDIKVDNIEENYIFGRNENKFTEYTIYLFPSTLYLKIYENHLKDKTQPLPEDAFGYIEGKENIEGGVDYETHFSLEGYGNYKDYTSYINSNNLYLDTQKVDVTERFFSRTSANHYDIVYDINKELRKESRTAAAVVAGGDTRIGYGSKSGGDAIIPSENPSLWQDEYVISCDKYDTPLEGNKINFHQERYNFRRHFKNDRFGFWSELDYEEGRILPQKIVVENSITEDQFSRFTMSPWCSMGDKNGWYDLNFATWIYVDDTETTNPKYPYTYNQNDIELGAFQSKEIDQYFDINKSLSTFADKDNIIRLFPYFSNSKGSAGSSYEDGGRDAVRMDVKNEYGNVTRYPLLYLPGFESKTIGGVENTNIAFVPNIRVNKTFKKMSIDIHPTDGPSNWGPNGDWAKIYDENEEIGPYLESNFGEGLYNFYLLIGNSCGGKVNPTDINKIKFSNVASIPKELSGVGADGKPLVPNLYNRNFLFTVPKTEGSDFRGEGSFSYVVTSGETVRSYLLLVEKVAEGSLYTDLNEVYATDQELKEDTASEVNAVKLYNVNENIYLASPNSDGKYVIDKNNNITLDNDYVYFAKNVDLTSMLDNKLLQIRFNNEYYSLPDPNIPLFDLSPLINGDVLIFNPRLENGEFSFEDSQVFTNSSMWFEKANIQVADKTQTAFRLKQAEYKGKYDLILEFNKELGNFKVYTYRYTNIFVKLFENKSNIVLDNDGLAIHKNADGSDLSTLLWRKEYYIGEYMKKEDRSDLTFDSRGLLIQSVVETFISNHSDYSYDNLLIRDYVTGGLVAYFNESHELIFNLRILKNYILYIDKKAQF